MVKFSEKTKRCAHVVEIPVNSILPNPNQPRKSFSWDNLESLAESIYQNGLLQPITVREISEGRFELIAGERRLRACKMAGLSAIPSIVVSVSDEKSAVFAVIENLQRQDLHFFEEAAAIMKLTKEFSMDRERLSKKLGKSPSAISNKLRLLNLPVEIQKRIVANNLTERHARALLRLNDFELMSSVIDAVVENGLNVAQTETVIDELLSQEKENPQTVAKKQPSKTIKDIKIITNTMDKAVNAIKKIGLNADSAYRETDSFIEYVVRVHKRFT